MPHTPKTGNRDCTLETARFSAVCSEEDKILEMTHGAVSFPCLCNTLAPNDIVRSSLSSFGEKVMCCPIPKSVEKFPKESSGMPVNGSLLNE